MFNGFPYFNRVQSACIDKALYSEASLVVSGFSFFFHEMNKPLNLVDCSTDWLRENSDSGTNDREPADEQPTG